MVQDAHLLPSDKGNGNLSEIGISFLVASNASICLILLA